MGSRTVKILLVEDEPSIAVLVKTLLQIEGWEVIVAENGEKALETFGRQDFDIVLMDLKLPGIDGVKTTEELRGLEVVKHKTRTQIRVPIIAFTAHAGKKTRDMCLSVGMIDFISKPVRAKVLLDKVKKHIHSSTN